ncbi:MAG TPA: 3-deoxy-7-phosphoheptulonate synthase [Candidatus Acidoferrum sp.]|nr:3-deoxy-7-phosphoheptulonate synthase [Candidatus Acidoferrum sp.]
MTANPLENVNVAAFDLMPSPEEIQARWPISGRAAKSVLVGRETITRILDRADPRLFLVIGPCSIHDLTAGYDYAERLRQLAEEVKEVLVLVMRVYFAKPRTATGWKGFINDPYLDDSFRIEEGMEKARSFLLQVAELGLPIATEALDSITPQYLGDLIAWTAIGARTAESQTHRELASGLSTPVGFKNATDGDIQVAINAIRSAAQPHSFLGLNGQGRSTIVRTRGKAYCHLVLRGGDGRPNYDTVSISLVESALAKAGLPRLVVVDCSHANSHKDPELQPLVLSDCVHQIREGNHSIVGLMVESNIAGGNQPIPDDLSKLKYGCSVTDPCVDWPTTALMVRKACQRLRDVLPHRRTS